MPESADEKQMKLRYAGTCRVCQAVLPARSDAIYERITKTVRCLTCSPANHSGLPVHEIAHGTAEADQDDEATHDRPIDVGTPGASARREFERRQARREAHVREKHPKLGGLILRMSNDPQSTTAWNIGAIGEERLGNRLNELSFDTMQVLHDRRIPGTKANIDHIAVTPTGVYVIDTKRYKGRPTLKVEGGILRPAPRSCSSAPETAPSSSTVSSRRSRS